MEQSYVMTMTCKQAPGVKKAIDEFVKEKNFNCSIICNGRFAKIEKN